MKKKAIGVMGTAVKGKRRHFNVVSEEKIRRMMEMNYEIRSEAKIKWAVKAYREWREMRLDSGNECETEILMTDLDDVGSLTQQNLEFALCRFIVEVKKSKENEDFPGRTLYQMSVALQNHLKKKGLNWKLVHGDGFVNFNRVLDKVMQERAALSIGTVRRQAEVISLEFENQLWNTNILGEDTADKLRSTVLYILGVNCALRAGDEHYALRRPRGCVPSQLNFEQNSLGITCLVYREDTVTKTNRGGLRDMKKERKVVWIKPNKNVKRCPVRIVSKYLGLLPEGGIKPNLYLHSLRKPKPNVWYGTTPLGVNKVRLVVKEMLKDAGLDGFFTNHSLRRTAATRLFQAGQNVKLIKEVTGHISNAVDKYEITSDKQKMEISSIIQGEHCNVSEEPIKPNKVEMVEISAERPDVEVEVKADCGKLKKQNLVAQAIETAVRSIGDRKARLSIHIDFEKE